MEHDVSVALACRLFGHCRQSFYQCRTDLEKRMEHERLLLSAVMEIRDEDPGIGGHKLWLLCCSLFGRGSVPGRDTFLALLRRKGLMLPPAKSRRTTNSNHRYRKWKNRIRGFVPTAANQLWVADITYIPLEGGEVCYLHLVTDAYSHMIVGWALDRTLKASASIRALRMAIDQAVAMSPDGTLCGLVHHSDRGVQYCCDAYVSVLRDYGIAISMTEDYCPTDNAVAERANGIIKQEGIDRRKRLPSFEYACNAVARFIHFYNYHRPHMSIAYKVPAVAHMEQGEQKKMWKSKTYHRKNGTDEENSLPLQSPGTGQDPVCTADGTVHRNSTALPLVSINSGRQEKNCLQKQVINEKSV